MRLDPLLALSFYAYGAIYPIAGGLISPLGVFLAQGMALPVLGEQNALQIGVALELDAHEVVGLPFVPVGGGPHLGHRIDGRGRVILQKGLQHHPVVVLVGIKIIRQGEPGALRGVIYGGDHGQVLEGQVGVVPQGLADLPDAAGLDHHGGIPPILYDLDDLGGELLLEEIGCEMHQAASLRAASLSRYCWVRKGSLRIFSWSFRMPYSRPSGRGGQPGM